MNVTIVHVFFLSILVGLSLILPACAQSSVEKEPEFVNTVTSKPPVGDNSVSDGSRCAEEPSYDFPTDLQGGYRLVFRTDPEFMYLDLYKDGRMIKELTTSSCGLPHKNLGYISADFGDTFVLSHSYGSGNPTDVELYRKSDGTNLLAEHDEACWVGADEKNSVFIYSTDCVPERGDTITLLNLRTGKETELGLPDAIFDSPEILGRIGIEKIDKGSVTLSFSSFSGETIPSSNYKY